MKHLKLYEEVFSYYNQSPSVGDYIITPEVTMDSVPRDFVDVWFRTHIGKVVKIVNDEYSYVITYSNLLGVDLDMLGEIFPANIDIKKKTIRMEFKEDEILYWSSDYDELKEKLNILTVTNKYNL